MSESEFEVPEEFTTLAAAQLWTPSSFRWRANRRFVGSSWIFQSEPGHPKKFFIRSNVDCPIVIVKDNGDTKPVRLFKGLDFGFEGIGAYIEGGNLNDAVDATGYFSYESTYTPSFVYANARQWRIDSADTQPEPLSWETPSLVRICFDSNANWPLDCFGGFEPAHVMSTPLSAKNEISTSPFCIDLLRRDLLISLYYSNFSSEPQKRPLIGAGRFWA